MFTKMGVNKSSLIRLVSLTKILLLIISTFLVYTAIHMTKINNFEVIQRIFRYDLLPPLMAASVAFVLVTVIGLVGILKEHPIVIEYHLWISLLMLVLELLIAVTTFPLPQSIPARTINAMNATMGKYETCWFERKSFDLLQNEYMCCGIHHPQDWKRFHIQEAVFMTQNQTFGVPKSCCTDKKCQKINLEGCFKIVEFLIKNVYTDFLRTVGCMALLQLLEMVLATWLILAVKKIENIIFGLE